MWTVKSFEAGYENSPFVPAAKKEGFLLRNIHHNYCILESMVDAPNYFTFCEEYADEYTVDALYKCLRWGMSVDAKNYMMIQEELTKILSNITKQFSELIISDDSSSEFENYDHLF